MTKFYRSGCDLKSYRRGGETSKILEKILDTIPGLPNCILDTIPPTVNTIINTTPGKNLPPYTILNGIALTN